MRVFFASIEVTPTSEAEVEGEGAVVDVYVPATIMEEAVLKLLDALREDKYKLRSIERFDTYEEVEWDDDETRAEAKGLHDEALDSGDVVYGVFYAWDQEHEH